jgi:hypothetical protein
MDNREAIAHDVKPGIARYGYPNLDWRANPIGGTVGRFQTAGSARN